MNRDNSSGGMLRTGQIPRLSLKRRSPVNVGPTIKEEDLVLVLLTRQRMALRGILDDLNYRPDEQSGRNRTKREVVMTHFAGLMELHELVAKWLPQVWRNEEVRREWTERVQRRRA